MEEFIIDNLELIVGAAGVLATATFVFLKFRKPAKNYGDLTQLVRQHKKLQQNIAPKGKLL